MELNIVKCKTEKYNVFVIADDEFVGYTVRTTGKFYEEWMKDRFCEEIREFEDDNND